mgnify:FL=1
MPQNNRISISDLLKVKKNTCKKTHDDEEHRLQCACVKWFRMQYPSISYVLFAIPNAARRSARNGAYMKDEGMLPGVSDLILLKSNRHYGALCIEMKTRSGKQSDSQKKWEQEAVKNGSKYIVCRSFEEFKDAVNEYIRDMT